MTIVTVSVCVSACRMQTSAVEMEQLGIIHLLRNVHAEEKKGEDRGGRIKLKGGFKELNAPSVDRLEQKDA